jgi:hypothetical protein
MSNLRPLLERNRAFAATGAHAGLSIMPRQQDLGCSQVHQQDAV